MGNSSNKMPKNGAQFFLKGPENFAYDQSFPAFEKNNGLLFRLVNTEARQWAFYNDTRKYEFHVTVTFGSGSRNLYALGKTSLVENPEGGWTAKIIVYPGQTEGFIQGDIVGFDSVINAILLTTEYQERKKEEKKEARKAAKRAAKGENGAPDAPDELGSNGRRNGGRAH